MDSSSFSCWPSTASVKRIYGFLGYSLLKNQLMIGLAEIRIGSSFSFLSMENMSLYSRQRMWTICESKQLIQSSGDAWIQVKNCPPLSKYTSRSASVASHRKNTDHSEIIGTPLELYHTALLLFL